MKIKRISRTLILSVSLLCLGCRENWEETSVTVHSSELRVDEKKGAVIWKPDRGVKKDTYKTYIFPLDHFREKVGQPKDLKGEWKLKIQTKLLKSENYAPEDPGVQQPIGGFNTLTYSARILESLP
jgi:hypothetical protein